jgi:XRE family transcriptional regulator, regulator of sulfur utilization
MAVDAKPTESHVGARLRELRTDRGLSLTAVAAATGLSASSLSLTENGKSDITFGRLRRLLDFYGVSFSELLLEPPPADPVVVRVSERRHVASPTEGIELFLLSHGARHAMEPTLAIYEPGGELVDFLIENRPEVFFVVLEGDLELAFEGHEPVSLAMGDSVLFEPAGRLAVRNPGSTRACLLAVGVTPNT